LVRSGRSGNPGSGIDTQYPPIRGRVSMIHHYLVLVRHVAFLVI
jgi:hypothetical protein